MHKVVKTRLVILNVNLLFIHFVCLTLNKLLSVQFRSITQSFCKWFSFPVLVSKNILSGDSMCDRFHLHDNKHHCILPRYFLTCVECGGFVGGHLGRFTVLHIPLLASHHLIMVGTLLTWGVGSLEPGRVLLWVEVLPYMWQWRQRALTGSQAREPELVWEGELLPLRSGGTCFHAQHQHWNQTPGWGWLCSLECHNVWGARQVYGIFTSLRLCRAMLEFTLVKDRRASLRLRVIGERQSWLLSVLMHQTAVLNIWSSWRP